MARAANHQRAGADVIEYCKAHLEEKVIQAIGVVIKEIRAEERMSE